MELKILGIIFLIGFLITFFRFMTALFLRKKLSLKFKDMLDQNGVQYNRNYISIQNMKEFQLKIDTDVSKKLLAEAELASNLFIRRFRQYLFFTILLAAVLIFMEG